MIAYHIDRSGTLFPGQTITLQSSATPLAAEFLGGVVSKHGERYLQDCDAHNLSSFMIEYEYELIRASLFSHRISRFQSFFAVEKAEDLVSWIGLFASPHRIFEVEFSHKNYQLLDGSYLTGGVDLSQNLYYSSQTSFESALHYWNGDFSSKPQPELLILPPVTVVREVHLTIGLT